MSSDNRSDDIGPLGFAALETPGLTDTTETSDTPIIVFVDNDGRKVTGCYATSNEPITVITHDYGTSNNKASTNKCGSKSLSFNFCDYLKHFAIDIGLLPGIVAKNSSTASELFRRADDLKAVLQNDKQICNCARDSKCTIWIVQNVTNFILGILLMALLFIYGPSISLSLLMYMESGVKSMIQLLEWLMGVPAGLKLNYNLTAFLGRFFMYHIWLWAEYLRLAGKYFDVIFLTVSAIGLVGGASLQVALLQDTFKVFLVHIYCFYIYCSRLYFLTRYALLALWRLFRGLKWNLLRKRVDHASYDSTQLFIGTLLFAILLFTLPTVFLYYLVFATLRAIIVGFHMGLDQLRYLLRNTYIIIYQPLASLMSNLCSKEEYGLSVQPSSNGNITVLTVRHKKPLACTNCIG